MKNREQRNYTLRKEEIHQPNARLSYSKIFEKTHSKNVWVHSQTKRLLKNSCEIIRKTEHCIKELFI